ncbi:MAG: AAA-like domain protein [Methanosaeta sp. PtaB.Bin039]|nr:MAG: AAA-like domain protein [Methanosaeta sp. PtaB.Bin039]HOT06036.1 ATP-binding protein [Methanotrichaceae archaeon]HQF16314.1 ATP-binding protein [Methanotrichaceae archaeon]HQI90086.1 ATP-binding protein [Methanotrichaceae archaeon]HQJ27891.1 ATP-binding protein [Methanotrichaceae archaeon]
MRGDKERAPDGPEPVGEDRALLHPVAIERNDTTYRIISKSVREYQFVIPYTDRAEVGEIFSIDDRRGDLQFLARVRDIEHDSNYSGRWDTTIRGMDFYDGDQIFNRVIAEPLGCVETGRFRQSRTIPTKFSQVHRTLGKEFSFLRQVMGDIEVGCLRNGGQSVEEISVALHSEAMDHHMGVFATTGMGKSNFMKVFCASCMRLSARGESRFGLMVVDPHGEYLMGAKSSTGATKGLMHLKNYRSGLACYSTDRSNCGIPEVEELTVAASEVNPQDVSLLYQWSQAQHDALEAVGRVLDGGAWMEQIQTEDGIARMVQEGFNESTVRVLSRRIRIVLDKNRYLGKRSSIPNIIRNLKEGKVVLVDIPRMSDRAELFLLSVLSRCIMEAYREPEEGRKNCLITIEEAQRVLGGSGIARFETIAREGRKFGVGLCAITQQPKLIDQQLLSQFNTLVVLGLSDRNDRARLAESAKQDLTSLDIEIQTMEKGEAIISTLKIPFPVPARIHRYEEYMARLQSEKREADLGDVGDFCPSFRMRQR